MSRAIGLSAALGSLVRRDRDGREPRVVRTGPEVQRLRSLAEALSRAGTSDADAVAQLRAAGHRRDLVSAAGLVRLGAPIGEDRDAARADALLRAAATGEPVDAPTAAQVAWVTRIDELATEESSAAFARLVRLEPRLADLESHLLHLRSDRDRAGGAEWLWDRLIEGLEPLVGPSATTADPLVRSETAFGVARIHLVTILGLELDPP